MSAHAFHLKYLEIIDDKIALIKGTANDDVITFTCSSTSNDCNLEINGDGFCFIKDYLLVPGLKIDSGDGNDNINITFPRKMFTDRIYINSGEGNNKIYTQLFSPYSSANIKLGNGTNTISFEAFGSNIFIDGFKKSPNNRIQIRDPKLTIDNLSIKKDGDSCNTYGVYLKSPDRPYASFHLCNIFNELSPEEYEAYAFFKELYDGRGGPIPPKYQSMTYVLFGPKDLASEILNTNNFIFSEE